MELKLVGSSEKIQLSDQVFDCAFNEAMIHQVVTAYMAGGRAGTSAQKTRAEVSGGGIKPWRQKGTGRARAGTIRSPIWRKGGVTFAAKPRCYKQKVNKKMYKGALRSIISELIRQDRLIVIDSFKIEAPKTKALLKKLEALKLNPNLLIIADLLDENLYLAARNLPHVQVRDAMASVTDPVTLVGAENVLITQAAMKELEGLLT